MVIFIDYDGTLRGNTHGINERTKKAIKKVMARGWEVVLCTARPLSQMLDMMREIGSRYAIACSGAIVYDDVRKSILSRKGLEKETLEKFLEIYKEGVLMHISSSGLDTYTHNAYLKTRDPISHRAILVQSEVQEFFRNNDLDKIAIHSKDFNVMFSFYRQCRELGFHIDGASRPVLAGVYAPQDDYYMDIVPVGVSKGTGIKYILDILGAKAEQAIAIGDARSDIAAFEAVGTGVAMGNAVPELKAIAKHVTATNKEDGVAVYLESL
ncbi:MAG: Cof-type HAD-IIB family hydrolase [Firmicutes bacterium]|nr:Cof-type HAD-IIB family hydrolase [Bacillota bacterium]